MKVCYVGAYYDGEIRSGQEFVDRIYTLREFAREQAELGAEVHVLQHFHRDEAFIRDGVRYRFIRPRSAYVHAGRLLSRLRPSTPPAHFQPATRLVDELARIRPDIIHFFGLTLDLNLWLVSRLAHRFRIPLVVHYNGGRPPQNRLRSAVQRGNLRRVDRLLFTTRDHARPWRENGLPLDPARVVPLMETSSVFRWRSRSKARAVTGMEGKPVFLWTGRLHPEKDPITALRGFERILAQRPVAQLYLYYLADELLPDLQEFVSNRPHLAGHVHFRGRAPYEQMESIYNSSDFFLQASTRETAGCAMLEAMSCGVIPVVTEIPSFREMTSNGRAGLLFPIGDDESLASGVLSIDLDDIPRRSAQVKYHFDEQLSFPALARQLSDLYHELIGATSSARPVA